jgi:hypothetical protein
MEHSGQDVTCPSSSGLGVTLRHIGGRRTGHRDVAVCTNRRPSSMPSPTVPGQPEYPNQPVAWPDISSWKRLTSSFARFGRPRLRHQALEMLIAVSDLPGPGWCELSTGSSRVGVGGNSTGPIAERAGKTGEFTAQRRFRNDQTSRGVMVQVLPPANSSDATAQVREYPSSVIRWSGVTTLE